jgi:hypothetical protein
MERTWVKDAFNDCGHQYSFRQQRKNLTSLVRLAALEPERGGPVTRCLSRVWNGRQ